MFILITYDVSTVASAGKSIRFYYLGDKYENKIEHYGLNASVFFDKDDLIL